MGKGGLIALLFFFNFVAVFVAGRDFRGPYGEFGDFIFLLKLLEVGFLTLVMTGVGALGIGLPGLKLKAVVGVCGLVFLLFLRSQYPEPEGYYRQIEDQAKENLAIKGMLFWMYLFGVTATLVSWLVEEIEPIDPEFEE